KSRHTLIAQLRQPGAPTPIEPHPRLEQRPSLAVTCGEELIVGDHPCSPSPFSSAWLSLCSSWPRSQALRSWSCKRTGGGHGSAHWCRLRPHVARVGRPRCPCPSPACRGTSGVSRDPPA